jgi:hypothetical protein
MKKGFLFALLFLAVLTSFAQSEKYINAMQDKLATPPAILMN